MLYSLTGNLVYKDTSSVAVDCGGVAYLCSTTLNTLRELGPEGTKVTLYTYLNVKQDGIDLYGFFDKDELLCFKKLITVSGIGPKNALAVLSQLSPSKLTLCIESDDSKSISQAKGVGAKMAQQIIFNLKGKLVKDFGNEETNAVVAANENQSDETAEAVSALVVLGYSQSEAASAVSKVCCEGLKAGEIVKRALKQISK